jgi:hypothetical protein
MARLRQLLTAMILVVTLSIWLPTATAQEKEPVGAQCARAPSTTSNSPTLSAIVKH